ncbi:murein biosynthesis integral membrane protein MurJ [Euzebyella saccharophila]|uniref:Murein biosynthesis integral membrane protein MurJ n=1 Tax=Euzebyella saccharophila TaxID=679664 RepID=A0ABV8JUT4_9FLAO|nr:lipid II flippase MurJ [Euzebyella saccharophila]
MINKLRKIVKEFDFKSLFQNQVITNILTVGILTILVKFIGFYKESVVAANFGLSEILDTFLIASLVPGFIDTVFLGAFKNVFIPSYVAELKKGKEISSFQSTGFIVTCLVSLFFMLIAYLFTDFYLETFFKGHTEEYYLMIKRQFQFLLPCIFIWGLSSLLSGLLNIYGEFRYSSLGTVFVPISIITSLFLLRDLLGYLVLALGTLLGSIIGLLYFFLLCKRKNILKLSRPDFRSQNAKIMFSQIPAKVSSGFLTGMNGVVDQYFAAQLAIGSIAAINYGKKMPAFLIGILVIAITNVLLPYFSKLILDDRQKSFKMVFKMMKITFLGGTLFAVLGILFTDFFVELFYQRKEFTPRDTELVSIIQKIFLIYIPFTIAGMINVNFLTSINKNAFMAYVSLIALVINIVLDYILIQYYGILGIAICTTIVVIIKNIIMFAFTYKESKKKLLLKEY